MLPDRRQRRRARDALRGELAWEGFGAIAAGVYARPAPRPARRPRPKSSARSTVRCDVVLLRGREASPAAVPLASLLRQYWDLASLARRLPAFHRAAFAGSSSSSAHDPRRDPGQCFVVRTLLIHAYRRVTAARSAAAAGACCRRDGRARRYALCRDFYRLTHRAPSSIWRRRCETGSGPLPPARRISTSASAA